MAKILGEHWRNWIYTLKLRQANHVVDYLPVFRALYVLDVSAFEQSKVSVKKAYRHTCLKKSGGRTDY